MAILRYMVLVGTVLPILLSSIVAQTGSKLTAFVAEARAHLEEGKPEEALAAVTSVLERDARHLEALELLALASERIDDLDQAVHAWHRFFERLAVMAKSTVPSKKRRDLTAHLLELDPAAEVYEKLREDHIDELIALGKDYAKRKDWLGALETFQMVLGVDPGNRVSAGQLVSVRRSGGREVAVDDVYAGGDPLAGSSAEEIADLDAKHSGWDRAHKKSTDNYRYRTNAGITVLETSAIAMEQMNRFYRRFFHYKENGGNTPKIEIRIFKNRQEYLEFGTSPAKWSGGQFTGDAVETYASGQVGDESAIRSMYRTLFHEAAHQFVRLSGPGVPGWLNEAYASFFEGCVILSNGTVRWNQVPPGRMFPLANRLEYGYMKSVEEAGRGPDGEFRTPPGAPSLRMIIENQYTWGPPWYAPTWGLVYFLYNYRDEQGLPIYRAALHEYYESFATGKEFEPATHFEEVVLAGSPLSRVQTVDELTPIWRNWILELRDRETGRKNSGDEIERFAQAAFERGDLEQAREFYLEALEDRPMDAELLWGAATVHEELKEKPRAAARYRQFKRVLDLEGQTDDERYDQSAIKIRRLDALATRQERLRARLADKGLALARDYESRAMPTMALEISRRLSAFFSVPEALDYYRDLAMRTGKSLARWKFAYNESNLEGWSGSQSVWSPYGNVLRAKWRDMDWPTAGGIDTDMLIADLPFDGDYSLEAQLRIPADSEGAALGRLAGLCFGVKSTVFHGVFLLPDALDVVTSRGGDWQVHGHDAAPIGHDWHTLRIDVANKNVDVYLDGLYVRSLEFANSHVLRGGFGLICGTGEVAFRNVRVLARDPNDPAARVEREIALKGVMADASKRMDGSFLGSTPPPLKTREWVQGEKLDLKSAPSRPVMLVFWSPSQDQQVLTTGYLRHLLEISAGSDLETIVVCDWATEAQEVKDYLQAHPLPGVRVAIDENGQTYDSFFVKAGHHGYPRILLIDREGNVQFEGSLGLPGGREWQEGDAVIVDLPLENLLNR